ncbi:MAG TPA: HD domain-containing phosphohydrolase [Pseudonocardiaceae bacterium]|jgi:HD-GYP domain-containing protein (c-di-GMP phosphodiesterase class II)
MGGRAEEQPLRLAEVVGVLSLASDLAMGEPLEHGLRTTLIATRLAVAMALPEAQRADVFYVALLHYAGCTAEGHIDAQFFGDEMAARPHMLAAMLGPRWGLVGTAFRVIYPGLPLPKRVAMLARSAWGGLEEFRRWAASHCEIAQLLGDRMGLRAEVRQGLGHLYERYDGKGMPGKLRGDDVPLVVRVMQVAQDAEIAWQCGGKAEACRVVSSRAGSGLDPAVSATFLGVVDELCEGLDASTVWPDVLDAEPGERPTVPEDQVEHCLSVVADFADLKSFYTLGHSRGVAALAGAAAAGCGLTPAEVTAVRRAGLVHDLGRVSVSARVWAKPGPLSRDEWEQVRLHAYYTERVLDVVAPLRPLGRLAGLHHERCDGSGYHRCERTAQLPVTARILAAADVYHAMTESRPHRPALSDAMAAAELRQEAAAGRLYPEAVTAVLDAGGHRGEQAPAARPHGLSDRETQVLRLLARGLTTKQIAHQLTISPKTCDHHIQRLYRKIGVTTRAGATLVAVEHCLLTP